jgi:hypothetical protein
MSTITLPNDLRVTTFEPPAGFDPLGASAYFTNRTTGDSTSFVFNAPSGTSLVGNCAEWIVDAPTVGGQQSSMADYGEVFFSVAEAFLGTLGGGGGTVNAGTGDVITMQNGAGQAVSQGSIITPTIVQCAYVGTLP